MKKNKRISKLWKDVRVKDIALKIHYGYTTSAVYENTGIKFLRITDIQDYKVAWNNVPFCEIDENDISKYLLKEEDIVFARTGATLGKNFLIQGKIPKAIFASYLIRIQLSKWECNLNCVKVLVSLSLPA